MNIYKDLEFDIILQKIAKLAPSPTVSEVILKTSPTTDIELADKLLTQTGDAVTVLASRRPNLYFEDILPLLTKARVGATLSPKEFLQINDLIHALRSLKKCVEDTDGVDSLKDITAYARDCEELCEAIDSTIENENEIKDSASEKLYSLRKSIIRANARLKEKLDGFTRQNDMSKYLQDNIVTVRGGRYVLPVRSDCKSHVKGLVHDVSSTGATLFIEPFAVVDANNELITLKTEEQNEIERILAALGAKVSTFASELKVGQEVLIECGVIFAKAEYAKQQNAYRPIIRAEGKIDIRGARHPLIDSASVVPVDITLGSKRVLLISGPNTGGKTVALKTVGLFSLFGACGIFLPAQEGSEIGLYSDIYCDIGDSQSIEQSLSTFSAHVKNLAFITSRMGSGSLVLLDEVGDGTDPDEGAALAVAIIKKIIASGATAVVTTHFNSVKQFALGCEDIANACMQFDSVNFRPTYRLLQGVSGSSYALEIAEKIGLDPAVIADARAALSREKVQFDAVLREVELMRNALIDQKAECDRLFERARVSAEQAERTKSDYERKLADINERATALIRRRADEYSDDAEQLIEQIKELLKQADEQALFEARKLSRKLREGVPTDPVKPELSDTPPLISQLTAGVEVYISGLDKTGVVASTPRGNKVVVAVGSVKTEVPISSLSLVRQKSSTEFRHVERQVEPETREVMLLGKTVDEATFVLDGIISDIPSKSTLRIVHGKGTGALGKGIQQYLRRQPRVKSFRYGRYGEGDTGVTIVEIK